MPYPLARLLVAFAQIVVVAALSFWLTSRLPGDAASTLAGADFSGDVEAMRRAMGLDRPLTTRFVEWSAGALHGDFGRSLRSGRAVADILWSAVPNTLLLATLATALAAVGGVVLAACATLTEGSWFDRALTAACLAFSSVPHFVLLVVGIAATAAVGLAIPANAIGLDFARSPAAWFLPAIVLAIHPTASQVRIIRAGLVDALRSPFAAQVRRLGISRTRLLLTHALPCALAPAVQNLARVLDYLLAGAVVVEALYAVNGVGSVLVNAIRSRDVPIVQACVMLAAVLTISVNASADVAARTLSPGRVSAR